MKIRAIIVSLLGMFFGLSVALAADADVNKSIDTVLGDHTKYETVINAVQKAVKAHDAAGFAALVSYPIKVTVGTKKQTIKTAKNFAKSYDKIMTPKITAAVVNQKYADLLVNQQGVAFGSGELWINGICKDTACKNFDVKIVTIQSAP